MHLDYYKIAEDPFDIDKVKTPLWLGGNQSKVASILKQAILDREGIISLAGHAGTGKNIIIKVIKDFFQDQFMIVTISNPGLSGLDIFNFLSVQFGFDKEFKIIAF